MSQAAFDFEPELCHYGASTPDRLCSRPATHAACWAIPDTNLDGTPNVRAGSGRVPCCLEHANYYANAWVPYYPHQVGSAWIDVLPVAG